MNYKETLFFIGKCLTINHEPHNFKIVEELLKSEQIDWDSVVKVSTSHYVFPALYCNLKRSKFLHYIPDDLVEYMKHITDLNRERNQQIIAQAKEINKLLLENNITPIFLKGTGNLLEGLYEDIAERMVGDIDFLIKKSDYSKTIELLTDDGYQKEETSYDDMTFHWHYPPLLKDNKLVSVEVHKEILKHTHTQFLNYNTILKNIVQKSDFLFESREDKILNSLLPKIINDNLYHSKNFSLRTMYDVFLLLSEKQNSKIEIPSNSLFKKFNNVLSCIKLTLNLENESKNIKINKPYLKGYLKMLNNSKSEKIKAAVFNKYNLNKNRFNIFLQSFKNKEFRQYALKRLMRLDFYKRLVGIRPNL